MTKERPILSNLIHTNTSEIEVFQNSVIRPIIKMQHNLLISFFCSYLKKRKIDFKNASEEKNRGIIKSSIEKDIAFKNKLIGSILGHFSMDEYLVYDKDSSEFNRRIKQILVKRLQDSIAEIK